MEKELRSALALVKITIKPLPAGVYAHIDLHKIPAPLVIDDFRGGYLENLVHELIHLVYARNLGDWGKLEEPIVRKALEDEIVSYINGSEDRVRWWRRKIQEIE